MFSKNINKIVRATLLNELLTFFLGRWGVYFGIPYIILYLNSFNIFIYLFLTF